MKPNDICFIELPSVETMNFYRAHSIKNPFLICPCKVPKDQLLVIDQLLTPNIAMLHYEDKPTRVTVAYIKDLVKAKRK